MSQVLNPEAILTKRVRQPGCGRAAWIFRRAGVVKLSEAATAVKRLQHDPSRDGTAAEVINLRVAREVQRDGVAGMRESVRAAGARLIADGAAAGPARKTLIYVNNRLEGNAPETISAMVEEAAALDGS